MSSSHVEKARKVASLKPARVGNALVEVILYEDVIVQRRFSGFRKSADDFPLAGAHVSVVDDTSGIGNRHHLVTTTIKWPDGTELTHVLESTGGSGRKLYTECQNFASLVNQRASMASALGEAA